MSKKKSSETDIEQYKQSLNERVEDGGGCAEMWEATQEVNNTDRRTFMAGVIGSLVAGVSATSTVSAKATDEEIGLPYEPDESLKLDVDVEQLNERQARNRLNSARDDPEVRQVIAELEEDGLVLDTNDVKLVTAGSGTDRNQFVSFRFHDPTESDESLVSRGGIQWNLDSDTPSFGYLTEFRHRPRADVSPDVNEAIEQNGGNLSDMETTTVEITHTTLENDDVAIARDENSRRVPLRTENQVGTHSPDPPGCWCMAQIGALCQPCGLPKMGCYYDNAQAVIDGIDGVDSVACTECVSSKKKWKCATCVALLTVDQLVCCPCDTWDVPNPL